MRKYPLENLVIIPHESSWIGFWKQIINMCLLIGYFLYPFFIAFTISEINNRKRLEEEGRSLHSDQNSFDLVKSDIYLGDEETLDMIREEILDIIMLIDIILNFFISIEKDGVWTKNVAFISFNYLKGKLVFDAAATIPCLVTN